MHLCFFTCCCNASSIFRAIALWYIKSAYSKQLNNIYSFSRNYSIDPWQFDERNIPRLYDNVVCKISDERNNTNFFQNIRFIARPMGCDQSLGLVWHFSNFWSLNLSCCRYESSPPSTLIFFAVQELILFSISLPLSYLLISGISITLHNNISYFSFPECITGMQSAYCLCVIVIIGTIVRTFI